MVDLITAVILLHYILFIGQVQQGGRCKINSENSKQFGEVRKPNYYQELFFTFLQDICIDY